MVLPVSTEGVRSRGLQTPEFEVTYDFLPVATSAGARSGAR